MKIPIDQITRETLRTLIATRLDIPPAEIPDDTDLVTLGMNSLELMTVVNRLRRQGVSVTYDALATQPTLDAWWHAIFKATQTP
jgi:mycobactin phenyloxazoline synthetase